MHFAWSHFRGVPITPHSRLLPHMGRRDRLSLSPAGRDGREAPVRAKEWVWERAGGGDFLPHCSGLRSEDFGPQSLHHSCWMKIPSHTFAVRKFLEKSS